MKRITFTSFFILIYLTLSIGLSNAQSTDATLSGINLVNGVLTPEFNPQLTKYVVLVPDGAETVTVTPVVNYQNASFTGGGVITLANAELTTITVTAENGTTKMSYVIFFAKENCYVPIFSNRLNLVPNPLMTTLVGYYGGWGATSVNTNASFVYCGKTSARITGANGGSIDFNTVAQLLEPGSSYLISAMIYVQGSGKAQIGHSINGSSILAQTTKNNQWEEVRTIVDVTSLNSNANLWLNNWQIGATGDNMYVDNFQMYKISNDNTLATLSANAGVLVPDFNPAVTDYYLVVDEGTNAVNINAIPNVPTSIVSGDGLVSFTNDKGVAKIVVTAENRSQKTYTIKIVSELPDMDASLYNLSVNIGSLSPVFNPDVTYYTLNVPEGTNKVNFTATANSSKASVSGAGEVDLIKNGATHNIIVTAESGDQKTYTIKWSAISAYRTNTLWKPFDGSDAPTVSGYMDALFMPVTESETIGALKIAGAGTTASIYYSAEDAAVVSVAANALQDDIQRITSLTPAISTDAPSASQAILIGTIGNSALIDGLIASGKINVSQIQGKWEAYTAAVVDNPMPGVEKALIIAGSDRRGTAFGVFALSESMGVSPWYFWGDVPVLAKEALYVAGSYTQSSPGVKYRGIFLNDEDWGLNPWAAKTFEPEVGNIGPKTYSTIFELLLRLHANCIWPAMHEWPVVTVPFYEVPGNKEMSDKYAIVISTSHHEPMMTNSHEYDVNVLGPYNYWTNRETIYKFWENRVKESATYENIYTIGMRGRDDSGMAAPAGTTNKQKAEKIQNEIIPDQRKMIADHVNADPTQIPQIFIPYKETLVQYQSGLKLPDDVTMVWPDDNHGYIRQLSTADERARSGGSGVYYHLSYWGVPRSYLWFSTTPPGMTCSEMLKAWDFEANKYWIVNVGDLKPMEIGTDFFLRMARNPEAFRNFDQHAYFTEWISKTFGSTHAEPIAQILDKYYQLNIVKRPEHLDRSNSGFSFTENGDEAQKRIDDFEKLVDAANAVYDMLEDAQKTAFYEMVLYQIRASYYVNKRILLAEKSRLWATQKRAATNVLAAEAKDAHNLLLSEITFYNKVNADGKWNYMLNPMNTSLISSWARETQNPFIEPTYGSYTASATSGIGVVAEGSATIITNGVSGTLPRFNRHANSQYFIDVFNTGSTQMSWTASASESWIKLSELSGKADTRILVSIDWDNVPKGCNIPGTITIESATSKQTANVHVFNPSNIDFSALPKAVENNGKIEIEAENFNEQKDANGVGWKKVNRATASKDGMTIQPVTAASQSPENLSLAPTLTYQFHAFSTGPVSINTQCLPTHKITSAHKGLRYGISLNGETPKIIDIHANEYSTAWNVNTLRAASIGISSHVITEPGLQTVKIFMVDAGVVLDKITIINGGGLYEAENLNVYTTNTTAVSYTDAVASGGKGLHIKSEKVGQFATLVIPNIKANDYIFKVRVKKWSSRGIMRISVAEAPAGPYTNIGNPYDLYSNGELYTDTDELPLTFTTNGTKYIRFEAIGKNATSSNYWILLDYISLKPVLETCAEEVNSINNELINNVYVFPAFSNTNFEVVSEPTAVITVYNTTGVQLMQKISSGHSTEVIIEQPGLYIITVNIDGIMKPFKVVKK